MKINKGLYLVATPIGNLDDISKRAVELLSAVDYIACEDTRQSLKLLNAIGVKKRLVSYYKDKEEQSAELILKDLQNGATIALISDAGMPAVSDPGAYLVRLCHSAGIDVYNIPGPSAIVSAYSLSGQINKGFIFLGFLKGSKKDKIEILQEYMSSRLSLIIYSSVHDVKNDLKLLYDILGDRELCICKELTKMYEMTKVASISWHLDNVDNYQKGEYVFVIAPGKESDKKVEIDLSLELSKYLKLGFTPKEAIKKVAKLANVPKDSVYKLYLNEFKNEN